LQSINPSFSGENFFTPVTVSYASLRSALQSHATSPDDLAAVAALANLPDPSGGNDLKCPSRSKDFRAAGPGSGTDDSVVLNTVYWTAQGPAEQSNDAIAVLEHELTEGAMGRIGKPRHRWSVGPDGLVSASRPQVNATSPAVRTG